MSENTENTTETPPAAPAPEEKDNAATVLSEVAERIKASTPTVRTKLVETLVEKEVVLRADLLGKALDARSAAVSELQKINKPDVVTYDADGKEVGGTYTKDNLKKIKEGKEKLAKIEKAIELALSGEWQKLKELKC